MVRRQSGQVTLIMSFRARTVSVPVATGSARLMEPSAVTIRVGLAYALAPSLSATQRECLRVPTTAQHPSQTTSSWEISFRRLERSSVTMSYTRVSLTPSCVVQ